MRQARLLALPLLTTYWGKPGLSHSEAPICHGSGPIPTKTRDQDKGVAHDMPSFKKLLLDDQGHYSLAVSPHAISKWSLFCKVPSS